MESEKAKQPNILQTCHLTSEKEAVTKVNLCCGSYVHKHKQKTNFLQIRIGAIIEGLSACVCWDHVKSFGAMLANMDNVQENKTCF